MASNIRESDLYEVWGKLLAGEIREPGSCSLKTLDILFNIDKKDALILGKLAKYVIDDFFIPNEVCDIFSLNRFKLKTFESLGLFIVDNTKRFDKVITVHNKYYAVCNKNILEEIKVASSKVYQFPAIILTPFCSEIFRLIPVSKEESYEGMKFFADIVTAKFDVSLELSELTLPPAK